jgi:hypothetical protein
MNAAKDRVNGLRDADCRFVAAVFPCLKVIANKYQWRAQVNPNARTITVPYLKPPVEFICVTRQSPSHLDLSVLELYLANPYFALQI